MLIDDCAGLAGPAEKYTLQPEVDFPPESSLQKTEEKKPPPSRSASQDCILSLGRREGKAGFSSKGGVCTCCFLGFSKGGVCCFLGLRLTH